jgi:dUTPase
LKDLHDGRPEHAALPVPTLRGADGLDLFRIQAAVEAADERVARVPLGLGFGLHR